jgi:hypothetical protein
MEAVAPTIARGLARGGSQAVGWFRSLLARASTAEKQIVRRLMAKAETQGWEALTLAERKELQSLLGRLDTLISVPLEREAKKELRRLAHEDFVRLYPELVKALRKRLPDGKFDVHHRIPLEFAHLFALKNINTMDNLVAVEPAVHQSINSIWGAYSGRVGASATPGEVEAVERIVRNHFERWYSKAQDAPASRETVLQATQSALDEVKILIARSGK